MKRASNSSLLALIVACIGACSGSSGEAPAEVVGDPLERMNEDIAALQASPEHDAEKVEVQHCLISFAGRGTKARRTREEAEALAAEIYAKVLAGEDFDALVRQYTDDAHPGIYVMTTGKPGQGEYARTGMVAAFGDVGWRVEVGEVGVAPYEEQKSPYGWHLVKRLR